MAEQSKQGIGGLGGISSFGVQGGLIEGGIVGGGIAGGGFGGGGFIGGGGGLVGGGGFGGNAVIGGGVSLHKSRPPAVWTNTPVGTYINHFHDYRCWRGRCQCLRRYSRSSTIIYYR